MLWHQMHEVLDEASAPRKVGMQLKPRHLWTVNPGALNAVSLCFGDDKRESP